MSYLSIYKKRLGRNGNNPAERLQKGREENFERFLHSSPHYVKFSFDYVENGKQLTRDVECVFEPSSQSPSRTVMDVLCRVGEKFSPGDIAEIAGDRYLFWYWDQRKNSGYNRWKVLKINHNFSWICTDGSQHSGEGYIVDSQESEIRDSVKSRSREATLYLENLNLALIIMPLNENIKLGAYMDLSVQNVTRGYRVTGYDFLSTPGVMYVSIEAALSRDFTPAPEKEPEDTDEEYFWLGGFKNDD